MTTGSPLALLRRAQTEGALTPEEAPAIIYPKGQPRDEVRQVEDIMLALQADNPAGGMLTSETDEDSVTGRREGDAWCGAQAVHQYAVAHTPAFRDIERMNIQRIRFLVGVVRRRWIRAAMDGQPPENAAE